MRKSFAGTSLLGAGALSLVFSFGCQGKGVDTSAMQESLTKITEKQDTILSKLEEMEKKVAAGGGARPRGPQPGKPDPKATYKVVLGDAAVKGSADAKVTIVEWSDFQCPYCSKVNPTMAQIAKTYGDDVRIAFKHNPLPFHKQAEPAAIAAEAAGRQGKFWEMHDKMFANQRALTPENFESWAKEMGLDVEKFKKDMADPTLKTKVKKQQTQGATLGARGTPAFFVNGRFISGARPFDAFKVIIDEEMKKADALIAAGTPKAEVYAKTIAKGKTKV
jgi:protein-disulfide isomerase